MAIQTPLNPSDWQTAYTPEQAFHDSSKSRKRLAIAFYGAALTLLVYMILYFIRVVYAGGYSSLNALSTLIISSLLLVFFAFALILPFRFARKFLHDFYRPPEDINLNKIVNYRLYGKLKLPPPLSLFSQFEYIIAKDGEILKSDNWLAWSARILGGPILLIVFDGCALYLERGNCFSRIVGPGDKVAILEWHETVKHVIDLRPKLRAGDLESWTKDGIKILLKVQIECRIGDPKKQDLSSKLIYPYDPECIKKAVERHSIRWHSRTDSSPSDFTWLDAAWGQVAGIISSYIGSRVLDDLFISERKGGQLLSPESVQEIFNRLNNATQIFGVYITDFQILGISMPVEVIEQQREYWYAERQGVATIVDGRNEALRIRAREKARAEAQHDLILAIASGLEKNKGEQYAEPLLLSLSRILDNSLGEPLTRAYLAKETLETLEKLQEILGSTNSVEPIEQPGEENSQFGSIADE